MKHVGSHQESSPKSLQRYAQIERENMDLKIRVASLEENISKLMINQGISQEYIEKYLEKTEIIDLLT